MVTQVVSLPVRSILFIHVECSLKLLQCGYSLVSAHTVGAWVYWAKRYTQIYASTIGGASGLNIQMSSILDIGPGLPTLTHMAWFSRIWPVTHALTQLTNLLTHLKEITRILTQFSKIENNLLFLIIVTVRLSVTLFIGFLLQNHSL